MADFATIIISALSILIAILALYISIRRFELQEEQFKLQKEEYENQNKIRLHIRGEVFLTSHALGPKEPKYYAENANEIEFEYAASYINRSSQLLIIDEMNIHVSAVDHEDFQIGAKDRIYHQESLAQNEELVVKHRITSKNLQNYIRVVESQYEKRGVLEFRIVCRVRGERKQELTHERLLYRLTETGGDTSGPGYSPGHGKEKHNFIY